VDYLKLNLGAGNHINEGNGWVNHDLHKHRPEIDVVHDLNELPWPWDDESASKIEAKNVFEHLDIDLVKVLDECWRILEPGGTLYIKVPNAEDPVAVWGDPTHRRPYTLTFVKYFDYKVNDVGFSFYTDRKWKIVDKGGAGNKNAEGIWKSIFAIMEKVK